MENNFEKWLPQQIQEVVSFTRAHTHKPPPPPQKKKKNPTKTTAKKKQNKKNKTKTKQNTKQIESNIILEKLCLFVHLKNRIV